MPYLFTKMQGCGNDFMILNGMELPTPLSLTQCQIKQWAHRHFGVGFDQLLLVTEVPSPYVATVTIYNSDGSEAQQCGNGMRCVAKFLSEKNYTSAQEFSLLLNQQAVHCKLLGNGEVAITMGKPNFINSQDNEWGEQLHYNFNSYSLYLVSIGNNHVVLPVDDISMVPVEGLGKHLQNLDRYEKVFDDTVGINVSFMEIVTSNHIKLRVYERGVGETLACGSGACAAMATARRLHLIDDEVTVSQAGGDVTVTWHEARDTLWLQGEAVKVYDGIMANQ